MCAVTHTGLKHATQATVLCLVEAVDCLKTHIHLGFLHGRAAVGIALAHGAISEYGRSGSRDQTPPHKCTINME
jgi:hypothetical protein